MFKKANRKKKLNCCKNEVHVSRCANAKKFDDHDFFICFNIEKRNNMNRKKYKTKNK